MSEITTAISVTCTTLYIFMLWYVIVYSLNGYTSLGQYYYYYYCKKCVHIEYKPHELWNETSFILS